MDSSHPRGLHLRDTIKFLSKIQAPHRPSFSFKLEGGLRSSSPFLQDIYLGARNDSIQPDSPLAQIFQAARALHPGPPFRHHSDRTAIQNVMRFVLSVRYAIEAGFRKKLEARVPEIARTAIEAVLPHPNAHTAPSSLTHVTQRLHALVHSLKLPNRISSAFPNAQITCQPLIFHPSLDTCLESTQYMLIDLYAGAYNKATLGSVYGVCVWAFGVVGGWLMESDGVVALSEDQVEEREKRWIAVRPGFVNILSSIRRVFRHHLWIQQRISIWLISTIMAPKYFSDLRMLVRALLGIVEKLPLQILHHSSQNSTSLSSTIQGSSPDSGKLT
ncbi:hypothetical protein JAAARDRAFT_339316 [Jaapia argillacea MUCL 33604]|uniref:Uncharacterized protein n=1 Tax=Jaapia argillacea MUCL 33604 TaxID=933084 RepID=A0A067PJP7_9AGAM|nr:hypothetical protein JAAARDRAFT_339316 [Jaapia argillacea MUCL 33604]